MSTEWEAKSGLAKAVFAAGFKYDPEQDITFSRMNALQRRMGYGYLYDLAAPATISAIIDCEPFFFNYNGKDWMIELWKGQYGLETGGEIGVYNTGRKRPVRDYFVGRRPHDSENSRFFNCVADDELLGMSFTLIRNGVTLFKRGPEKHWWLTGFKWGELSAPEELKMDLHITFPNIEMCKAFIAALEKAGYHDIIVNAETVSFSFDTPTSHQPRSEPMCSESVRGAKENNTQLVEQYRNLNLANNDPNQIPDDFISYFQSYLPENFLGKITAAF